MGNKPPPVIVFFHQGFSPYLGFTLAQARVSQPTARVLLLGDSTNRIPDLNYEHRLVPDTSPRRKKFLQAYRHFHPGSLEDERRCIERWLILADFLEEEPFAEFLFLDSDVLLLEDLSPILPAWKSWDAAGAPLFYSFCYFFQPGMVTAFADWILRQYRDPRIMQRWEARFQRHLDGERADAGIIQDMELCRLFAEAGGIRILDVTRRTQEGWLVDTGKWGGAYLQGRAGRDRLRQSEPGGRLEAEEQGQTVRFLALHVQGFDKSHIAGFTGWPHSARKAFFRPNYLKNLKFLFRYLVNGARCRSWLQRNQPFASPGFVRMGWDESQGGQGKASL